ncbi:YfjI family protein [Stutzerimonas nitrititolerans]|jgi:hypothetical protein|uniref:YfjI family protein n=1 Tax=Stutzerimonas nitrititolerans TaxID=2482751 RepID=UPI0028A8027A|nr:YfjI family protein [Stutzerimonas nitrititolerans]
MNASLMTDPTYPEPLRLLPDLEVAAPFPLNALGEVLGGAAAAIVEAVQVPEALAAQSILTAAALATQSHGNVERDGQLIPLSLFALTIAESGDRKSAADRLALRSHYVHQQALLEAHAEEQRKYRDHRDAYQRARTDILERSKGDPGVLAAELTRLQEPMAPSLPFILAEEPTLEGLQKSLLRGRPSQGLFSDEGGQFFGGYASKPENILKSVAGLSKLWDGAPVTRLRAADGESASRSGCRLSAHLMIQPVVAESVLGNPVMRGQGFLARFLIAWPQSLAGTRLYRSTDPNLDPRFVRYSERMTELLNLEPRVDDRGNLAPPTLTMDSQSKSVWIKAHDEIEVALGRGGDLQEIKATAAKGAEHILRIAGILAIVENTGLLAQPFVERATELVRWYLVEALRLTSPVVIDPDLMLAQQLLDWLREKNWVTFDARTLQRDGPRLVRKSAKKRDHLLVLLAQHRQLLTADGKNFRMNPLATSSNVSSAPAEASPGVANVSPAPPPREGRLSPLSPLSPT